MGQIKHEFDCYASNYRSVHNANIGKVSGTDSEYFSEYKIRELSKLDIIDEQARWLDLGCGDGTSAKYIKKWFPKSEYLGIDVSEDSIKIAKSRDLELCCFKAYDGCHIPAEDNEYDVVFISTVMHHIPPAQWISILKECKRVKKTDGLLVIFEHNPYNPLTRRMVNTCPFDENAVLVSNRKCISLIKQADMKPITRKYTIFFPRKKMFTRLINFESMLTWIPLGGQYYIIAK